jgi:hypothetical protein
MELLIDRIMQMQSQREFFNPNLDWALVQQW